ncbi:hypothetical protein FA15DRAFT_673790 [Coprinopsis marcescibilis]|uniref:DUF6533 domain-containing protein n=1 Tax=Coprinopsis marcescibilis TaxID=230819 RepID=A0A5C3KIV2_COPMA|nr:hypothetical protein FA15DRAFT_673790 [Coprinopsis marcescibilis]
MSSDGLLPIELMQSISRLRDVAYVDVISLAFNLADYLQTSEWEYEYFWSERKWTPVKAIYLTCRYLGIIDYPLALVYHHVHGLTPKQCQILFTIAGCSALTAATFGEILMFLRVYILSGCTRFMAWYLTIHFSSLMLVIFSFAMLYLKSLSFSKSPAPEYISCYMESSDRSRLGVMYAMVLLHQLGVLSLSFWFGLKNFRSRRNGPLIQILYRDGTIYVLLVTVVAVSNMVVVFTGPVEYQTLFLTAQRAIHSTMATRIVLKMREMARRDILNRTRVQDGIMSSNPDMDFATVGEDSSVSAPWFTRRQHEFIEAGGPSILSRHVITVGTDSTEGARDIELDRWKPL